MIGVALALLALLAPQHASAQRFRHPSSCHGGCLYVSAYFDHGGVTDWACGGWSYGGHTGTDMAIYGRFAAMDEGRDVLAVAPGRVIWAHDGEFDRCESAAGCGSPSNGVGIQHPDGTATYYFHLRRGSVAVRVGDGVGCGQHIGQIGSSGRSTGPHLHFEPRLGGSSPDDPYAGGCSGGASSWVDQGGYRGLPAQACEGCDGQTRGCGSDVGECRAGIERCSGSTWGGCEGAVWPVGEDCNGRDDDCDGATDEGLARGCGSDVGECRSGSQRCSGAAWGACEGEIPPEPELCDELDNDCDGASDDEQVCEHEEVRLGAPIHASRGHSDVDGDGRADACARTARGIECLLASEHGFARMMGGAGPDGDPAALRMGDLDGDRRADACALAGDRIACWRSEGVAFEARTIGPFAGAIDVFDLADVDGDGRDDLCARDARGLACHRSGEHGFEDVVLLRALGDDAGFADVVHHGSLRLGDVDGDGRADACARDAERVWCWLSEGTHFGERVAGPAWSDAAGWSALSRWSTIRLADVDGDGRDDLCGRAPEGFRCHLSEGRAFGVARLGPELAASDGWERREAYTTIRIGDVDGDGDGDLCARDAGGVRCWRWSGRSFDEPIVGPRLTDAQGWDRPDRYRTIRLADVDGDGRADLCARSAEGLRCDLSDGHGFSISWRAPAWGDDDGLAEPARSESIRIAGVATARPPVGCGCAAGGSGARRSAFVLLVMLVVAAVGRSRRAIPRGPAL